MSEFAEGLIVSHTDVKVRVEDMKDWSVEEITKFFNGIAKTIAALQGTIIATPTHWPPRYNANTDSCDVISGPCVCGAWHYLSEAWILDGLNRK